MNTPRGYYGKWNKSDRKRQIPYDFTYLRNLKNKNKQTNRLIDTGKKMMKSEGINKYKLVVTK